MDSGHFDVAIQHAIVTDLSNHLPQEHFVADVRRRVELIVKLAPAAAKSGSPQHLAVQACFAQAGLTTHPLDLSASDAELATYFIAHVDPLDTERIINHLLACDGIESAYAKPRGEPPR